MKAISIKRHRASNEITICFDAHDLVEFFELAYTCLYPPSPNPSPEQIYDLKQLYSDIEQLGFDTKLGVGMGTTPTYKI